MSFVVAIDGPAGSGKGTITKAVGEKLNLINIDTGAMYRCVALYMIEHNIGLDEVEKIEGFINNIKIEQKRIDGEDRFFLDGVDVSQKIRENEVNSIVSPVSHIVVVRQNMVQLQRKVAEGLDVIMEGRDIGTNVFPNADVKIYLDATPEERARRRYKQNLEKGIESTYEEVYKAIIERDHNDLTSDVAPLRQAEDAVYVDTTGVSIPDVVARVMAIIEEKRG